MVWEQTCRHPRKTGNIALWLSDISAHGLSLLLIIRVFLSRFTGMKHLSYMLLLVLVLLGPAPATASDCYADYKAKQDNPLRLHYGVAEVSNCSKQGATRELRSRLAARGWTLLNVMSVFGKSGLAERKDSAGPNYLRY